MLFSRPLIHSQFFRFKWPDQAIYDNPAIKKKQYSALNRHTVLPIFFIIHWGNLCRLVTLGQKTCWRTTAPKFSRNLTLPICAGNTSLPLNHRIFHLPRTQANHQRAQPALFLKIWLLRKISKTYDYMHTCKLTPIQVVVCFAANLTIMLQTKLLLIIYGIPSNLVKQSESDY